MNYFIKSIEANKTKQRGKRKKKRHRCEDIRFATPQQSHLTNYNNY